MQYQIHFQYKSPDSSRPDDESASHFPMPLLKQGEFMPIPAPGDSVQLLYAPNEQKWLKVLTRHFDYATEGYCIVNIVVTDISDDEMAARLKC